ncbi:HET-domain-containing protein [Hypoxylon sp. NC1633]|nr:HET-domain-containing protein [Hypoxylon sp. NC1633]
MTFETPRFTTLCQRCRVLEFDDSAWPRAHEAGSETEGYYLAVGRGGHIHLKYELRDSLPDLPVLSESELDGCGFCPVLKKAIQRFITGNSHKREFSVGLEYLWNSCDSAEDPQDVGLMALVARVDWIGDDDDDDMTFLRFDIEALSGNCGEWLRLEPSRRDEVLCPDNLQMIFDEIEDSCHTRTVSEGGTVYPTRLIEVGDEGADFCRLVETESDPILSSSTEIPFATLSYCWGPPEDAARQFQTERSSLDNRLSGFPIAQVSPILRDAIQVARALRIPYLWVDAVCIIQDDKDDWDRESSRMGVVYKNATLTICTPTSTSCQEGFVERESIATGILFQSTINENISGSYLVRFVGEADGICDRFESLHWDCEHSGWALRGWTLQEFELSQRIVVFGKTRLHVRTSRGTKSEAHDWIQLEYESGEDDTAHQIGTLPQWIEEKAYKDWIWLIQRYSRRQLTHHTDKLPAISGLVTQLLGHCPERYLAGHLVPYIDLFWGANLTLTNTRLTKTALTNSLESRDLYVAPSWSWASRSHGVDFRDFGFCPLPWSLPFKETSTDIREECEVMNASISLEDSNPFGRVKGGSLVMRGVVVPPFSDVRLLSKPTWRRVRCRANENGSYVAYMILDWTEFEDRRSLEGLSLLLIGSCEVARLRDPVHDEYEDELPAPLEEVLGDGLQAGATARETEHEEEVPNGEGLCKEDTDDSSSGDDQRSAYGIVIHPSSQPGKYLRLGIFYSIPLERGGLQYFQGRPMQTVEII